MKLVGYGVVNAQNKPVGIWPSSLLHAIAVRDRRNLIQKGHEIVPVYIGGAVKASAPVESPAA